MTRRIHIGLLWHSLGHGNLGVDALTRSNIAILRAACRRAGAVPHFVLLGAPGRAPPDSSDVEQGPRLRLKHVLLGRSAYLRALRQCDLVLDLSEGDSFTEIYGQSRLAYQAGTKIAALLLGRTLILAPQTLGPFTSPWGRALARWIIRHARAVFSRDALSTAAARKLGCGDRVIETTDVAFRLPHERAVRDRSKVRVGINLSGLMYDEHRTSKVADFQLDYRGFLHRLIPMLLARDDVEVWLVAHVVGGAPGDPDDYSAAQDAHARFPATHIAPRFESASEAKSFISGLDFFTGGRMHACIAAFSAGVPVVPIAYSRKFSGLFGSLGYDHGVDARSQTVDGALEIVMKAFAEREALKAEIERGLLRAEALLGRYETEMADIIAAAAPLNSVEAAS